MNKLVGLAPLFVQTASDFSHNEEQLEDSTTNEMVIEILGLIILISEHASFFEQFRLLIPTVIVKIVLNLMKTQTAEFDLIETDP